MALNSTAGFFSVLFYDAYSFMFGSHAPNLTLPVIQGQEPAQYENVRNCLHLIRPLDSSPWGLVHDL